MCACWFEGRSGGCCEARERTWFGLPVKDDGIAFVPYVPSEPPN